MTTDEKRLARHVRTGRHDLVKPLLDQHPSLCTVRYDNGRTWLHNAAEQGHLLLATVLLDAAPELLRATDDEGLSVILLAARNGHRPVLDLLLDRGVNPGESFTVRRPSAWVSGHTLLHAAASHAMHAMVRHLLGLGVPVDAVDSRGMSALWLASGPTFTYQEAAAERPNPGEVVRALLAAGANPFLIEEKGRCPADRLAALPPLEPRRMAFEQKLQEQALRETMAAAASPVSPVARPRSRL